MAMFYLENKPHAKTRDGIHIATQNHFDYICREGKYERLSSEREDMVYRSCGNMPSWAKSEKQFWTEAERHRRFKGRAYREVKFALQEELTLEENIALVEKFCDKIGISKNHAYSYAIHDKPAAFDHSHRNIHCHLMFSECTIEPQRPLGPEQYFCRYSKDKYGNPTGGYYKDRYFHDKECTLDMRRIWAQIVNEKFAEKGLDVRISEKSLEDQYYELKKAGQDDEAEYYNRKPAPHLGKMYRNPKNMGKINNFTRNLEKELEDYTDEESGTFYDAQEDAEKTEKQMKEASLAEQKMIIFAADALMRRIAREIQIEKKKEREVQKALEEQQQIKEELSQPIVITIADVRVAMDERANEFEKNAAEQEALFKDLQKRVLSDKVIAAKAEAMVFPQGRDIRTRMEEAKKQKTYYDKAIGHMNPSDSSFDKFMTDYARAIEGYNKANGAYLAFEKQKEAKADLIQKNLDALKAEQTDLSKQSNEAYRSWNFNKKQAQMYRERIDYMDKNFSPDKILYADTLSKTLERKNRIEGKTPCWDLKAIHIGNSVYFILNDKKELCDPNYKKPILAVREGDFVVQGKVPVYEFSVVRQNATAPNGKNYQKVIITEVHQTKETINIYKTHNYEGKATGSRNPGGHLSAKDRVKAAVASHRAPVTNSLLDKLCKNAASGNLIAFKEDNDRPLKKQDEYLEAEKEMENFGKSIHLGGMQR